MMMMTTAIMTIAAHFLLLLFMALSLFPMMMTRGPFPLPRETDGFFGT